MAIGFTTSSAYGSRNIIPDKGLGRQSQPRVRIAKFGDGYEQRIADGLNPIQETFSVSFNNREAAEIDDIIGYLASLGGVASFDFTFPDDNGAGGETTIKVVCDTYGQTYTNDGFPSATATFRRVYEA
jgi:phage-related protein